MILRPDEARRAEVVRFPDVKTPGAWQLRTVREWMEQCLREASLASARGFGARVRLDLADDAVQYGPSEAAFADGHVALFAPDAGDAAAVALTVPREAAAALVDFLLGDPSAQAGRAEAPTRVDRAVLRAWFEGVIRRALASLPGGRDLRRSVVAEASEAAEAGVEGFAAQFRIRFPAAEAQGCLFVERGTAEGIGRAGATRRSLLHPDALADALVTLTATLGRATVSLGDLRRLEPGDVLLLDPQDARKVVLKVEGMPRLEGRPGVKAGRMAVEITSSAAEEAKAHA